MFGRSALKRLYFNLLRLSGDDGRLLRRIRERGLLVVLNLHQVSPHSNPFWPPLDPRLFEELLLFVKPRFNVCLFRDLGAGAVAGGARTPLILSFDDGYYNFVEYAMPLLAKHGLAVNMNVIPSSVESGLPPWNVQLYDFLNSVPRSLVNEIRLPGLEARLADERPESKVRYGLQLSRYLKNRPRAERERLWPEVERAVGRAPDFGRTRMMCAADVREAAAAGHEIGVHSFSHESMEFEGQEFFAEDLEKCFRYFERKLRLPLNIYAFPNGSYRPEQVEFLRRAGIEHVLLVGEGFARPSERVYERFTFYGDSPAEAKLRALGYNARKSLVPA